MLIAHIIGPCLIVIDKGLAQGVSILEKERGQVCGLGFIPAGGV
jgi:hypothetical protein